MTIDTTKERESLSLLSSSKALRYLDEIDRLNELVCELQLDQEFREMIPELSALEARIIPLENELAAARARILELEARASKERRAPRAPDPEFQGVRERAVVEIEEGGHRLAVAVYLFQCGTRRLYVEVSEDEEHAPGAPVRVHEFSTAVHCLQNVGELEVFQIGNRDAQ